MLAHIQITAAKPAAKSYSLFDSQGVGLFIRPNDSKPWRFKYCILDCIGGRKGANPLDDLVETEWSEAFDQARNGAHFRLPCQAPAARHAFALDNHAR